MGKMMIDKLSEDIPVVVIRPSVVKSTFREPFSRWMEGNRIMDSIVLCYGKGHLTGFLVKPNGVLDLVPADMILNTTLTAMAMHGMAQKPDINVYQIASSLWACEIGEAGDFVDGIQRLCRYLLQYVLSHTQMQGPFFPFLGVGLACLLMALIGLGRIYLGMHSLVDILGSLLIGLGVLAFWLTVGDFMDNFVISGQNVTPFWAAFTLELPLALCLSNSLIPNCKL